MQPAWEDDVAGEERILGRWKKTLPETKRSEKKAISEIFIYKLLWQVIKLDFILLFSLHHNLFHKLYALKRIINRGFGSHSRDTFVERWKTTSVWVDCGTIACQHVCGRRCEAANFFFLNTHCSFDKSCDIFPIGWYQMPNHFSKVFWRHLTKTWNLVINIIEYC